MFNMNERMNFLISSNHSLHGLPLLDSPSIVPNITSFTSLNIINEEKCNMIVLCYENVS